MKTSESEPEKKTLRDSPLKAMYKLDLKSPPSSAEKVATQKSSKGGRVACICLHACDCPGRTAKSTKSESRRCPSYSSESDPLAAFLRIYRGAQDGLAVRVHGAHDGVSFVMASGWGSLQAPDDAHESGGSRATAIIEAAQRRLAECPDSGSSAGSPAKAGRAVAVSLPATQPTSRFGSPRQRNDGSPPLPEGRFQHLNGLGPRRLARETKPRLTSRGPREVTTNQNTVLVMSDFSYA